MSTYFNCYSSRQEHKLFFRLLNFSESKIQNAFETGLRQIPENEKGKTLTLGKIFPDCDAKQVVVLPDHIDLDKLKLKTYECNKE